MVTTFARWEQRARYAMSGIAILGAAVALSFKLGWIKTDAAYENAAWYSVTEHAGFVVTTRHADEAGCRDAAQNPSVTCRSGRALSSAAGKEISS